MFEKYPQLIPTRNDAKAVARADAFGIGVDLEQTISMQVHKLMKLDMKSLPCSQTAWKGYRNGASCQQHLDSNLPKQLPPYLDPDVCQEVKQLVIHEGWLYIQNTRPVLLFYP